MYKIPRGCLKGGGVPVPCDISTSRKYFAAMLLREDAARMPPASSLTLLLYVGYSVALFRVQLEVVLCSPRLRVLESSSI